MSLGSHVSGYQRSISALSATETRVSQEGDSKSGLSQAAFWGRVCDPLSWAFHVTKFRRERGPYVPRIVNINTERRFISYNTPLDRYYFFIRLSTVG